MRPTANAKTVSANVAAIPPKALIVDVALEEVVHAAVVVVKKARVAVEGKAVLVKIVNAILVAAKEVPVNAVTVHARIVAVKENLTADVVAAKHAVAKMDANAQTVNAHLVLARLKKLMIAADIDILSFLLNFICYIICVQTCSCISVE